MDWSLLVVLAIVAAFYWWRHTKGVERAKVATARLESDKRLYQHIKTGMREYHWRERENPSRRAKHGEKIFETAHLTAFRVEHFAELRVGFYFKDLDEYGLYGFFAGNGDEFFESYYRTDNTFTKEEMLLADDDD